MFGIVDLVLAGVGIAKNIDNTRQLIREINEIPVVQCPDDIDNPEVYKYCYRRRTDMYVCKPPSGVFIFNKFIDRDIIRSIPSAYFNLKMLSSIPTDKIKYLDSLVEQGYGCRVRKGYPYIAYTPLGDLLFMSDNPTVFDIIYQNGQTAEFSYELEAKLRKQIAECHYVMPWYPMRTNDHGYMSSIAACQVPIDVQGSITVGEHEYSVNSDMNATEGDFIVAPSSFGNIDMDKRIVMPAKMFRSLYSTKINADGMRFTQKPNLPDLFSGMRG